MANQNTINAPQRRKIELNSRQKIILFSILPLQILFGFVGYSQGWISNDKGQDVVKVNPANMDLPVTGANVKPIEEFEKKGSSVDELNPTGVGAKNPNDNFGTFGGSSGGGLPNNSLPQSGEILTGNNVKTGPQSNSYTYEQEKGIQNRLNQIQNNTENDLNRPAYGYTKQPQRTQVRSMYNAQNVNDINSVGRENAAIISDIYNNPVTPEQQRKLASEATEKRALKEREKKYDDAVLELLKENKKGANNENNQRGFGTSNNSQDNDDQTPKPKKTSNGRTSALYADNAKVNERETLDPYSANQNGSLINNDNSHPSIISQKTENAFFGLNGKRTEVNKKRTRYETIEGYIHGSGDGVTVANGTTVKIRIKSETKLQLQGEEITLQPNTIISGVCSISGDRILVKINTLRVDNFLYPVQMTVYDLDGQQGIYVKDLSQKTQLNNALVQSASQSVQPSYFVGQGNIGTQVGTQLATSSIQSVTNVGKQIATAKLAQIKAFIRPNYQVYLKFQEINKENN